VQVREHPSYRLPEYVSPSQLSTFTKCPLQYWFASVAGWREPPSLAMVTGTLVHDVLEKLMALPAQERTPDTAWELLRTLGAKTVDDLPKYGLAPAQAQDLKEKSAESLKGYFEIEDPREVEIESGGVEQDIRTEISGVRFNGRIDRVTEGQVRRVTDYKTGKRPEASYLPDTLRQVMLYAAALTSINKPVDEVELLYLNNAERVRRPAYRAAIERATSDLVENRAKMESAFSSLSWLATPGGICRTCAFRNVCPTQHADTPVPGTDECNSTLQRQGLSQRLRQAS
jgi:putative RecB family exonuclease